MNEVWKDIVGYEGFYKISNFGNVKSFHYGKEYLLKLGIEKDKLYHKVSLNKYGKIKTIRVHRLVAKAFIPNPYNLPDVNHKDENKQNNMVQNLEWCDKEYNNNYGTKIERGKEKKKQYLELKKFNEMRLKMDVTQKSFLLNIILLNMLSNLFVSCIDINEIS